MSLEYPFINLINIFEHLLCARNCDSCNLNIVSEFPDLTALWGSLYVT